MTLFFLIEGGLLALPVIGFWLALTCHKRPSLTSWLYKSAGILAAISLAIVFSPFSLTGILPDAFVLMAAYAVYCAVTFSMVFSRRWKPTLLGIVLGIPIILGWYLRITLGAEIVKMAVAEIEPERKISVGSNYECRLALYGYATDSGVYDVRILYQPPLAPLFEWQIARKKFFEREHDFDSVRCLTPEDTSNGTKVVMEARLSRDGTIERTNVPR